MITIGFVIVAGVALLHSHVSLREHAHGRQLALARLAARSTSRHPTARHSWD
jgi:hypothetical protein